MAIFGVFGGRRSSSSFFSFLRGIGSGKRVVHLDWRAKLWSLKMVGFLVPSLGFPFAFVCVSL